MQSPWHMWGNSVELLTSATIAGGNTASGQLLKIEYKRPETWSFFFAAQILRGVTPDPNTDVVVLFDLIAGVGRSSFVTQAAGNILIAPGFARLVFRFAGPTFLDNETNRKYTTRGSGPPLDDTAAATSIPTIEAVAAQDIQVQVRARISGTPGSEALVQASGWFAPLNHVRPEWFSRVGQFPGEERLGR